MNPITTAAAAVLIAAAAGLAGYGKGYFAGKSDVQQAWDKEKAIQMAEYAKAQEEARKKEQQFQASAETIRKEKEREIREITARNTALVNSLQQRSDRPKAGEVSGSTRTCSGASGAELARGDSVFLAGYSADAARLQTAYEQCVKQYNQIREGMKNGN